MYSSGSSAPARLTASDAGELLTLQRAAYVTEAQLYATPFLPALTQTFDELVEELVEPALGVRVRDRLVGAVRWTVIDGTAHIGRVVVAPDLQGRGIGRTLLRAAERESGVGRFALFTGHLSVADIRLDEREGYRRSRVEQLQPGVELVHFTKSLDRAT